MSLKSRLLVAIIGLIAFIFCLVDVVTYNSLQTFLIGREDQQLFQSVNEMTHELVRATQININLGTNTAGTVGTTSLQAGALGQLRDNGAIVTSIQVSYGNKTTAFQPFPLVSAASVKLATSSQQAIYVTATPKASSEAYRVLIYPLSQTYVLLEAFPLTAVNDTMTNLLHFEIYTGVLAVAAAILIGLLAIKLSLSPIDRIRKASKAVSSGDLSQRLEVSNPKTEIGELQTDFNNMVARIQEEFYLRSLSEQRLREFLSDASHELRTPLTFILGYADLLLKNSYSQDPSIEKIKEQASRMSKLIEELLVLARLDEGQKLQFEPVDLRLLAHELAADVLLLDPSRNVKVNAAEPMFVMGDSVKLRQVVTNFASNIFNHTKEGTPVSVTVTTEDNYGVYIVSDYGKGVTDLNKIFERFYRENKVKSDGSVTSGSGLGLSIVYAIIQAHNGTITARPTESDSGLTFEVKIPLADR